MIAVFAIHRSRGAALTIGVVAGLVAVSANLAGVGFGYEVRAAMALPVLGATAVAVRFGFRLADALPAGTDDQRRASEAAIALVGLAIAELLLLVILAFRAYITAT